MVKKDFSDIPYLLVGGLVAVEEEVQRAADRLVEKGKSLTPEGRKKAMASKKGLISKGDDFSQVVARTVKRVLENAGLGTRADLDEIDRRVNELEKKLSASRSAASSPAKKPAAKKAAKKAGKRAGKTAGKKAARPAGKKAAKKAK